MAQVQRLLFTVAFASTYYSSAKAQTACSITKPLSPNCGSGAQYDFGCLADTHIIDGNDGSFDYMINIGGIPSSKVKKECSSLDFDGLTLTGVQMSKDRSSCYIIGAKETGPQWAFNQNLGGNGFVSVLYKDNQNENPRQMDLLFLCNKTSKFTPYFNREYDNNGAVYEIDFRGPQCCLGGCASNSQVANEVGWGLVGVLIGGAALYVGIGFAFNTYKLKKEGRERFPHVEFWSSIPGLVKDGVSYSKNKILRREGGTYESV
eukprot:m.332380 g.332380  ORF g.332380 m.332380 type:complete len:262 (+) comp16943_c0_seq1:29-814(+)